ncbi:MarR family winged helix-turn-helix transcriptional regulator [Nonomuraea sp. NPDC049714]|uniref:MarR family winged helix-turn-helix transcriptional regulator n=1 Tax=Nonomuraea sp. NPDC049714 TaxID=3364357 RepID=UPI0037A84A53
MAAADVDEVDPLTRPYYLIYQLSYLIGHDLDRVLRPMGLTRAQLGALSHLAREGDMSAADLARKSHVTAQSMGAALTQLAEAELVARQARKENARVIDTSITDKGRRLYTRVRERLRDAEARLLVDLDEHDVERLVALLRHVYGTLHADETADLGR